MKLFTNWFSPFARKVALALDYKQLPYEALDGLAHANLEALRAVNPRAEVPALVDGDLTVTQSAQILAYLEDAYPGRPIFPASSQDRARARALEHLFDTRVDAILVDSSLWNWAQRDDQPPEGLKEVAQKDLNSAFDIVEQHLSTRDTRFAFGDEPGAVEFTLWPHMAAIAPLGLVIDKKRFPSIVEWLANIKSQPLFRADAKRTIAFLKSFSPETHEKRKIAWRGDRIEWMLAKGYHDWFFNEINSDRVIWPAL